MPFWSEAATYVPLDDEVYDVLRSMEAEGIIRSGLLTTMPLSRKEVLRLLIEAERNPEAMDKFIQARVRSLKKRFKDEEGSVRFIKPLDTVYARYVYADSNIQNSNSDGDLYQKGSNLRLGFSGRAGLRRVSFYINPEFRYSDDRRYLTAKSLYGVLSFWDLNLIMGSQSAWWGPGHHGALLLSNNAEPLGMLRLETPQPVILPWLFKYFGPFRLSIFLSELERKRDVSSPYFWGMRFNFKPHPYFELGFQRTAILGGQGREKGPDTWWRSFTGEGENEAGRESGDQKAGMDLKITMPFKLQPIQLYLEAAGEDSAGGMPTKWAYLGGVYLPRLINFKRIDFRAEYAVNHVGDNLNAWYNHHIYTSGYTYKGRIIGHHMGTDSEDIFFEMNYLMPEIKSRLHVSCDIERHNLSGYIKPSKSEAQAGIKFNAKDNLLIEARYTLGRFKDMDNISGNDKDVSQFSLGLNYYF